MEKKTKEPLRHIAARIPRQCACKILDTVFPVCKELDVILSSNFLLFPDEGIPNFPIPLSGIYGTLVTRDDLYILCENGVFHHFERETRNHEVVFLDDCELDFNNRFLNWYDLSLHISFEKDKRVKPKRWINYSGFLNTIFSTFQLLLLIVGLVHSIALPAQVLLLISWFYTRNQEQNLSGTG